MLPAGSAYRGAKNKDLSWNEDQYMMAHVIDLLRIINWRLMGCPAELKPSQIERPGDRERAAEERRRAKEARRKIENTRWEAI